MKTKLITFCGAAAIAATSVATAAISLTLELEVVKDSSNQPINDQGLLVLVVDTANDGFSQPVAGEIVPAASDDEIVATWDLTEMDIAAGQDYLQLLQGGIAYSGNWEAGQKLALIWFPGLAGSETPAADEAYGFFTDVHGLASGDTWTLPPDNKMVHNLKLFTSIADSLVFFGDFPDALGKAAFAVNNPPGSVDAITVVTTSSNKEKIDITWQGGASSSGGFIIQRSSPGSGNWRTVGFASNGATSYSDSSIVPGFTYSYRVLAGNGLNYALAAAAGTVDAERSVLASVAARSLMENKAPRRMYGQVDVVGNAATKKVIIQASGPWLSGKIIGNPVLDPSMELYNHPNPNFGDRVTVDANIDNWMESPDALVIDQVQADFGPSVHTRRVNEFAINSKDASWVGDVISGTAYTFAVNTVDGSEGPVHIGIYNAEEEGTQFEPSDNRIVALATRGYLGTTPGHKMFGEFTIEGNVKKTVLIRGLGPNLAYFPPLNDGNPDRAVVQDPSITLYSHPDPLLNFGTRTQIAFNDDWGTQVAGAAGVVITDLLKIRAAEDFVLAFDPRQKAYDQGSKDALLLVELDPGVYTFALNAPGTGIGLLGVYEVEAEL